MASTQFYQDAVKMIPLPETVVGNGQWGMGKPSVGYLIYSLTSKKLTLDLSGDIANRYIMRWIRPTDGTFIGKQKYIKGGSKIMLETPIQEPVVLWLSTEKQD